MEPARGRGRRDRIGRIDRQARSTPPEAVPAVVRRRFRGDAVTTICNDPAEFTDEAVEGFVDLYPRYVRRVMGGVVRAHRPARPKVAVLEGLIEMCTSS